MDIPCDSDLTTTDKSAPEPTTVDIPDYVPSPDDIPDDSTSPNDIPSIKFRAPRRSCVSSIHCGICRDLIAKNRYKAVLQDDGNLVILRSDGTTKWSANSNGGCESKWKVTENGRIIVVSKSGSETWQSNNASCGIAPYYVRINDTNLVLYDSTGKSFWSNSDGY